MNVDPTALGYVLGAIIGLCAACAIEGIVVIALARRLLRHGEQLLNAAQRMLAQLPGKSASRTEADDDPVIPERFPRLRFLAALRDLARELTARAGVGPGTTVGEALTGQQPVAGPVDDGGQTTVDEDETSTVTPPAQPHTEPAGRAAPPGGPRLPVADEAPPRPPPPVVVDDVDERLVRFGLRTREGGQP